MSFQQSLSRGKIGESAISTWLNRRGFHCLPVYEKEISEHKGPTLFCASGEQLVLPDILVFKDKSIYWVEAKHKTAFTWHRITSRWVTGIDLRHYEEYMKVQALNPHWEIWLFFLHRRGVAKDTPDGLVSPSGLFGHKLNYLSKNENHRHGNWGSRGMVYWACETLRKIAEIEEFTFDET